MAGSGEDPRPQVDEVLDLGTVGQPWEPEDGSGDALSENAAGISRRALLAAAVLGGGGLAVLASRAPQDRPWTARPPATPPAVTFGRLRRPLAGTGADWDLFALGADVLLRIRPASGRVTRTRLPTLPDGEVSFVAASAVALIRPIGDGPPGWAVRDDQPPVVMAPELAGLGPVLPGPDPRDVWTQLVWDHDTSMVLVDVASRRERRAVPVPRFATTGPMADGRGGLLFEGVGGVYTLSPEGVLQVNPGIVLAVGSSGLLTLGRDDSDAWRTLLRPWRGSPRAVPVSIGPQVPHGVLSPDGTKVALYAVRGPGTVGLDVVDLRSGARRALDVAVTPAPGGDAVVWAPDNRALIAADETGHLRSLDPATGAASLLSPDLPPVQQLAVRALP
jgi:hypothetical protein